MRTAELAWVPKTTLGFRIVMVAAAAAAPTNSRRPTPVSLGSLMASSPLMVTLARTDGF